MNRFDLEKALAGEKVITRDGREVTQLVLFDGIDDDCECIYAFVDHSVLEFYRCGTYCIGSDSHSNDLFMAPKKLSGFVNVYADYTTSVVHSSKEVADDWAVKKVSYDRLTCIDLSQFEEGHGL